MTAGWQTSISSKRPVLTASFTSAAVVPLLSPAKIGPCPSSTCHISVFGSPPVTRLVASLGCTCTLKRRCASITLKSNGKRFASGAFVPVSAAPHFAASSSNVRPASGPSATTDGEERYPDISHDSTPHNAEWRFGLNVSG